MRPALDVFLENHNQPSIEERERAHFLDNDRQFLARLVREFFGLSQICASHRRVFVQCLFGSANQQGHRERLLFDRVVQIAGNALTFLQESKLLARCEQRLDLVCHLVEILGQVAEFIGGSIGDSSLELAPAPGVDSYGNAPQTASETPGGYDTEECAAETNG